VDLTGSSVKSLYSVFKHPDAAIMDEKWKSEDARRLLRSDDRRGFEGKDAKPKRRASWIPWRTFLVGLVVGMLLTIGVWLYMNQPSGVQEVASFQSTDANNRRADFKIYILNERYSWKLGSSLQLLDGEEPVELRRVLNDNKFLESFCQSKAVFAMGAASFEGTSNRNHDLAQARAERSAKEMDELWDDCFDEGLDSPKLYTLSLGEHCDPANCPAYQNRLDDSTDYQRRLLITAVPDFEEGVDLRGAMLNGTKWEEKKSYSFFSDFVLSFKNMMSNEKANVRYWNISASPNWQRPSTNQTFISRPAASTSGEF